MPVTTRSQHARQALPTHSDDGDISTPSSAAFVGVTTPNTGEGKRWRQIYSDAGDKGQKFNSPSPATGRSQESDISVTPVPSMPCLFSPIQHASQGGNPRQAGRRGQVRFLVPDGTILQGTNMDKSTCSSSVTGPIRQALGPEGTWLVDEDGDPIFIEEEVRNAGQNGEATGEPMSADNEVQD